MLFGNIGNTIHELREKSLQLGLAPIVQRNALGSHQTSSQGFDRAGVFSMTDVVNVSSDWFAWLS